MILTDGPTLHTANATMKLLNKLFANKHISKNGDVSYPPWLPDLTAPDFFLWVYLMSSVYATQPQTLQQLKQNIRNEINAISADICGIVMKNVIERTCICLKNGGEHLAEIIFHS